MLVSVVMPSLNQAAFIERSVRSVLAQAGPSIELLVMDGGSTDGTQTMLARLTDESNGQLRWWSEADHGPAHAINKAMAKARGEIIGWLNADDIYMPGAVARAVEALEARPELLMVYGHGRHIDACDQSLGEYPTRLPDTPVEAFGDGCFICQPTVFIRQRMRSVLGELDESLKASFDLDWWLRLFRAHPKQVGFVDAVQAGSRLHGGCITQGQRETVIREGMQVLAKHLGASPLHWLQTYIGEVAAEYPQGRQIKNLKTHVKKFARSVAGYLSADDRKVLKQLLKSDARIRLAEKDACLGVDADGWLPPRSTLRVRSGKRHWKSVVLHGSHVPMSKGALRLRVRSPDGNLTEQVVPQHGPFTLEVAIPKADASPAYWSFSVTAEGGFIPSEQDPNSDDHRHLACRIDGLELH